eukprot:Skav230373  [mRNA]  locus=scaffold2874:161873:176813:- [translate_table: standard]
MAADLPHTVTIQLTPPQRGTGSSWPSTTSTQSTQCDSESEVEEARSRSCSASRRQKKVKRQEKLKEFLKKHGFSEDVTECRAPRGCFCYKETLWPLHVAARDGHSDLVRMMLMQGAEPDQLSSKGKTAKDFARKNGHQKVLDILDSDLKVVGLRKALELMSPSNKDVLADAGDVMSSTEYPSSERPGDEAS